MPPGIAEVPVGPRMPIIAFRSPELGLTKQEWSNSLIQLTLGDCAGEVFRFFWL